ncbi:hypothetical protein [Komagataeibacter swingsii]|uniref:hypothetical protein n=1 Tax=Komagataeibacter swingsii TaxID=215220 RepID=UPI0038D07E03
MTRNHPFNDASKRTGWSCCILIPSAEWNACAGQRPGRRRNHGCPCVWRNGGRRVRSLA